MALITCPECSKQVSDQASSCPSCGYPITQEEEDVFDFNDYSESSNYAKTTLGVLAGYNITPEVVCPHCGKRGCVATKRHKGKKGISGAKATGAIFTLGVSLLATGLSRKEWVTDAVCNNCGSRWTF